jgi:hypothetical protein
MAILYLANPSTSLCWSALPRDQQPCDDCAGLGNGTGCVAGSIACSFPVSGNAVSDISGMPILIFQAANFWFRKLACSESRLRVAGRKHGLEMVASLLSS